MLEWFDFAVYGYFSSDIGKQFFPDSFDAETKDILSLVIFFIGFVPRAIGGLVLGMIGDRIGRTALMTLSIALMGGATLLIGLLPTFNTIGWAAPILLLLCRIVQGFSLGGEFTGSMVYTTELASPLVRGIVASSTAAGTTLGFILGSGTAWAIQEHLGKADASEWGWRIPFIGSVIFCIIGWFLRNGIHESEHAEKSKAARAPVFQSLVNDWRPIAQTFGIVAMTNAAYYLTFTFAVDHRKNTPGDTTDFLAANTMSLFVVLFAKVLGGFLSDRLGRKRMMVALTIVVSATVYFALKLMMLGTPGEFMLGQVLLGVPLGMALGLQGAMVVEIFPVRTRVTSMSFAYSITLAIAGGTAPLVSKWLISQFGSPLTPAFYIMLYGVIGLAILIPMRETNSRSLDE